MYVLITYLFADVHALYMMPQALTYQNKVDTHNAASDNDWKHQQKYIWSLAEVSSFSWVRAKGLKVPVLILQDDNN